MKKCSALFAGCLQIHIKCMREIYEKIFSKNMLKNIQNRHIPPILFIRMFLIPSISFLIFCLFQIHDTVATVVLPLWAYLLTAFFKNIVIPGSKVRNPIQACLQEDF